MSRYQADPNNPKKQIPKQTNSQNSAGIAVFATDVLAQVANPTKGTMTYSVASDKIFIYNGTAWKTWTRD